MEIDKPQDELAVYGGQLATLCVVNLITVGCSFMTTPVLMAVIQEDFHSTQYVVTWLPAAFELSKGLFALPGGFFVHRFGAVRGLKLGAVVVVLVACCYPFAQSLWALGVVEVAYGLSYVICGLPIQLVFLKSMFRRRRNLAVGLLVTSFGSAGAVFPPIIAAVSVRYGWRVAAMVPLTLAAVVMLPLALCVLREPSHTNAAEEPLLPSLEAATSNGSLSCVRSVSFRDSLRLSEAWHLAVISFCEFYVVMSMINTFPLFLKTDAGMPLQLASMYNSMVFAISLAAKCLVGYLSDSESKRCVGMCACLLLLGSLTTAFEYTDGGIAVTTDHRRLFVFSVLYGLGYGASFTVVTAKPAILLGEMPEFSKLQSWLFMFQVAGGFCGTVFTAKLRHSYGSYTMPFIAFAGMAVLLNIHYVLLERCTALSRTTS